MVAAESADKMVNAGLMPAVSISIDWPNPLILPKAAMRSS
jgi:hypothetical protein